eukprot:TRINITY_DN2840_c0_g3_i1.p1 TRINITY_DN2840_c0_g3~~TRINITY_DN2840_c0_g3_i1.p1  ORF type:complete len:420 (+),score=60.29 TRINITY_DN2840_c0_g3_i1:99-1262(+)
MTFRSSVKIMQNCSLCGSIVRAPSVQKNPKQFRVCSQSVQKEAGELQDVYYKAAIRLNKILNSCQDEEVAQGSQEELEDVEQITAFGKNSGVIVNVINGALEATISVAFCRALDINILGNFDSIPRQQNAFLLALSLGSLFALFRTIIWKEWHFFLPSILENYYLQLKTENFKTNSVLLRDTDVKGVAVATIADITPLIILLLPLANGILTKIQEWIMLEDSSILPSYLVQFNSLFGVAVLACIAHLMWVLPDQKEVWTVKNAISSADRYYNEQIGQGEESSKAAQAFRSVATTWILSSFEAASVQVMLTFLEIFGLQVVWIFSGNLVIPGIMLATARFPNYYFGWKNEQESFMKQQKSEDQQQQQQQQQQLGQQEKINSSQDQKQK